MSNLIHWQEWYVWLLEHDIGQFVIIDTSPKKILARI